MCRTTLYKSRKCGHTWIQLHTPCKEGMNLLTCPDFTAAQPYGPAEMPNCPGRWAPEDECPRCDYETYDMRRRRMLRWTKWGVRWGVGPGKKDPGVDIVSACLGGVGCCGVM